MSRDTRNSKQKHDAEARAEVTEEMIDKIVEKVFQKYQVVISEHTNAIENLNSEVKLLKEENAKKDAAIDKLQRLVNRAERRMDDLEQYSRRNNARIFGVPEVTGEDVGEVVAVIGSKMDVTIDKSFICRAHRVGMKVEGKPRPIIVKFTSYAHRSEFFKNKRKLKGSRVSVAEDLTKTRATLLYKVTRTYPNNNVWTMDGVIRVRYQDSVLRVVTEEDLDTVLRSYPPLE